MATIWRFIVQLLDAYRRIGKVQRIIIVAILIFSILSALYVARLSTISTEKKIVAAPLSPTPAPSGPAVIKIDHERPVQKGKIFTVTLPIELRGNQPENATITVKFDPQFLLPVGIIPGDVFGDLSDRAIQNNTIVLRGKNQIAESTNERKEKGNVATITFMALQTTDGTLLTFDRADTKMQIRQENIPTQLSSAMVTIYE